MSMAKCQRLVRRHEGSVNQGLVTYCHDPRLCWWTSRGPAKDQNPAWRRSRPSLGRKPREARSRRPRPLAEGLVVKTPCCVNIADESGLPTPKREVSQRDASPRSNPPEPWSLDRYKFEDWFEIAHTNAAATEAYRVASEMVDPKQWFGQLQRSSSLEAGSNADGRDHETWQVNAGQLPVHEGCCRSWVVGVEAMRGRLPVKPGRRGAAGWDSVVVGSLE